MVSAVRSSIPGKQRKRVLLHGSEAGEHLIDVMSGAQAAMPAPTDLGPFRPAASIYIRTGLERKAAKLISLRWRMPAMANAIDK
jgi:hypothetical protein